MGDQAAVDVHMVGSQRRQRVLREPGLQSLTTGGLLSYCQQAHDASEGEEDIDAIFKRIVAPLASD